MAVPAMTNNSPEPGHISWAEFHIQYLGVGYLVAAGSSSDRWVWWRYNGGVPTVESGPLIPSDFTDDDLLLFGNKNGIAIRMQNTNQIDGELLVSGSVFAEALAVGQISSAHIVTAGLDAGLIKFGQMSGQRIMAETITAQHLGAGSVTALALAAEAVTAEKLAAGAITAEMITSGGLQATIALLGQLFVGEADGRRIIMDPNSGFMLVDADDNILLHFPILAGGKNTFVGDIDAEGLTVRGVMSIRGLANEIAIQSGLILQTGVTKPSNYVSIQSSYLEPLPGFSAAGWYGHEKPIADDGTHLYTVVSRDDSLGADSRIQLQRHRWSDGVRELISLKFMDQTGYSDLGVVSDDITPSSSNLSKISTSSTLSPANTTATDPREELVNGFIENIFYPDGPYYVSQPAGWQWVQYDLGSNLMTSGMKATHYWSDGRRYNRRIETSEDGVNWTVVYNTAVTGTIAESRNGIMTSWTPRRARYIREYLNGSNINTGNHWSELRVYGSNTPNPIYAPAYAGGDGFDRIVVIGNYLYLHYYVYGGTRYESKIGKFDKNTGQQVAVLDYELFGLTQGSNNGMWAAPPGNPPALNTDGTSLLIAQVDPTDSKVLFRWFNPDNFNAGPTQSLKTAGAIGTVGANIDLASVNYGAFDFGAGRYIVRRGYVGDGADNSKFYVYDTAGMLIEAERWQAAASSSSWSNVLNSLLWRSGRFMMSDNSKLVQFSTNKTSEYVYAGYTFYDDDPGGTGTHETDIGPVTSAARKPRYGLSLSAAVGPVDTGDPDSPNTVRIYAMQGTYTGNAQTLRLQAVTSARTATIRDNLNMDTTAPPIANTFVAQGAAAKITSAQGGFIVKGDGTGAWPHLEDRVKADVAVTTNALDSRLDALEAAPSGDPRKVGEVIMFYGTRSQCPAGFLIMDGATFSGSTYPALQSYLGSTTLPNMSDRVAKQPAVGQSGGELEGASSVNVTLSEANMPSHRHNIDHDHSLDYSLSTGGSGANIPLGQSAFDRTSSAAFTYDTSGKMSGYTGSGSPFSVDVRQKSMALWHAIKAV